MDTKNIKKIILAMFLIALPTFQFSVVDENLHHVKKNMFFYVI